MDPKKIAKTAAAATAAAVAGLAAQDLLQKEHALRRNFPLLARARYALERIGPELRQYIVTGNDEERPFSRDQRRWVYASAKAENNYFAFGTDNDVENTTYPVVKHRTFSDVVPTASLAIDPTETLPSAKILGGPRGRRHAFRPRSVVNVSAMSFGSLSPQAIQAINRGAKLGGFLHNTGEGGLSDHHRQGGELILQIGTGYFGCRDENGDFDLERLARVVDSAPVRAIEIKLSQGAKPGLGGHLPGAKVNAEIARIRGVEQGKDVISPSRHTAFRSVDELLDFVERVAERTGVPVGIKSAVGDLTFWQELADLMQPGDRGVDFIAIDGGEGGTGAAPLVFSDTCHSRSGLARGLDPADKSVRLARYVQTLRRDLFKISEAAGVAHPALLGPDDVAFMEGTHHHRDLADVYGYQPGWGMLGPDIADEITRIMTTPPDPSEDSVVQTEPLDSQSEPRAAAE